MVAPPSKAGAAQETIMLASRADVVGAAGLSGF
jgi:hypothetical protein